MYTTWKVTILVERISEIILQDLESPANLYQWLTTPDAVGAS